MLLWGNLARSHMEGHLLLIYREGDWLYGTVTQLVRKYGKKSNLGLSEKPEGTSCRFPVNLLSFPLGCLKKKKNRGCRLFAFLVVTGEGGTKIIG